jgi:hypothetical protein
MSKKPSKEELIHIIHAKSGIKTEVAKAFGVDRRTICNWRVEDPDIEEAFIQASEALVDMTESSMYLLIQGVRKMEMNSKTGKMEFKGWIEKPSERLIEFILRNKGVSRGYSEKKSLDITSNGQTIVQMPVQVIPNPHEDQEE